VKLPHVALAVALAGAAIFAISCDSGDDDGDDGPCGYSVVECAAAPGTNYPAAPVCIDGNWVCDTGDAGVDSGIGDASSLAEASLDASEEVDDAGDASTDAVVDGGSDAAGE